jgi:hypothetical protein
VNATRCLGSFSFSTWGLTFFSVSRDVLELGPREDVAEETIVVIAVPVVLAVEFPKTKPPAGATVLGPVVAAVSIRNEKFEAGGPVRAAESTPNENFGAGDVFMDGFGLPVALKSVRLTVDAFIDWRLLSFSFVCVSDTVFIDDLPDTPVALVKVLPTADAGVVIVDDLFVSPVKVGPTPTLASGEQGDPETKRQKIQ